MGKHRPHSESRHFSGRQGKRRLLEAVKSQTLISGDGEIAGAMASCGMLQYHKKDSVVMRQGEPENDICLVLAGEVSIRVNGRPVAARAAGTHVGEMALADALSKRSATVIALEPSVTLRIPEDRFSKIAEKHPVLWRRIAVELAKRLRERNKLLQQPHNQPVLFIGSSSEGLLVADEIYRQLRDEPIVSRPWSDGVFQASRTSIESLVTSAQESDFAALVLTSDDVTISRGRKRNSPRDNVIFELGLFIGALGRERVFILKPKGIDVRIPSDLLGVTWLEYLRTGRKKNRTQSTCEKMIEIIKRIGPR